MVEAWIKAGRALGVEVIAPFAFESRERSIRCTAFIRHFGRPDGTVVVPIDSPDCQSVAEAASEAGYYCSFLAPVYEQFDRDLFVSTLDDWGWFGDEEDKPAWYSGMPWS